MSDNFFALLQPLSLSTSPLAVDGKKLQIQLSISTFSSDDSALVMLASSQSSNNEKMLHLSDSLVVPLRLQPVSSLSFSLSLHPSPYLYLL